MGAMLIMYSIWDRILITKYYSRTLIILNERNNRTYHDASFDHPNCDFNESKEIFNVKRVYQSSIVE